jgi:hypothetical protein
MTQVLTIRIEHDLVERLADRARRHGVSVEEEARHVLQESLRRDWRRFWQQAEEIRSALRGRQFEDSADLIREDRDR